MIDAAAELTPQAQRLLPELKQCKNLQLAECSCAEAIKELIPAGQQLPSWNRRFMRRLRVGSQNRDWPHKTRARSVTCMPRAPHKSHNELDRLCDVSSAVACTDVASGLTCGNLAALVSCAPQTAMSPTVALRTPAALLVAALLVVVGAFLVLCKLASLLGRINVSMWLGLALSTNAMPRLCTLKCASLQGTIRTCCETL